MFKGVNRLILNEATMIVAVQEYFNARAKEGCAPKVTQVKAEPGQDQTFSIHVEASQDIA